MNTKAKPLVDAWHIAMVAEYRCLRSIGRFILTTYPSMSLCGPITILTQHQMLRLDHPLILMIPIVNSLYISKCLCIY